MAIQDKKIGPQGFDLFWSIYPKRVAKADAMKAWLRLSQSPELLDRILKALMWQRTQEQWLRDGGQFIPYPASYIRGERWEDAPEIENLDIHAGKMWFETVPGIEKKAAELGMKWDQLSGETFLQYRDRVKAEAQLRKVVPMVGVG